MFHTLIASSINGPSYNRDKYFKKNLMTIEYNFPTADLNLHLLVLESTCCNFFQGNALNYPLIFLRIFFSLFKLEKQKCHNNCETIQSKNVSFWQVDFSLPGRNQRKSADERKIDEAFGTKKKIISVYTASVGHLFLCVLLTTPIYWPQTIPLLSILGHHARWPSFLSLAVSYWKSSWYWQVTRQFILTKIIQIFSLLDHRMNWTNNWVF